MELLRLARTGCSLQTWLLLLLSLIADVLLPLLPPLRLALLGASAVSLLHVLRSLLLLLLPPPCSRTTGP
jgi:hypothetical protein